MQTDEFGSALKGLTSISETCRVVVMGAEAVPWCCDRSLLSDALTAKTVKVLHIMGEGKIYSHNLTSFAKIEGNRVSYPPVDRWFF